MRIVKLITFFIIITTTGFAQDWHYNHWALGDGVHVDFTSGIPVANCGLPINASEGCASYSDPVNGDFIAYTDGQTVYNGQSNNVLANGTGLIGSSTSIETALILPKPGGTKDQFFIFHNNINSCYWSEADMSIGVDGTIVTKNTLLSNNVTERSGTVPHGSDCLKYWVVISNNVNAGVAAYCVDTNGISNTPVISPTGITGGQKRGNIVFSNDYTKMAMNVEGKGMYVADFDNITGQATNFQKIGTTTSGFGSAFSPDGTKVYYTNTWSANLYQYDLNNNTETYLDAGASSYPVLARDGKIYVSRYGQQWIGVVNNPNVSGIGCDYVLNGVSLPGCNCRWGLPNPFFLNDAYLGSGQPDSITLCSGNDTLYTATQGDAYVWHNGDTTQTQLLDSAGTYWVQITKGSCVLFDTVEIAISNGPTLVLGEDTIICSGTFDIDAGSFNTYVWNTGDTSQILTVDSSGIYIVQASDGNCFNTDSIQVQFSALDFSIGPDTVLCENETLTLDAGSSGVQYFWSTTETTQMISVNNEGEYYVIVEDSLGCNLNDTINVAYSVLGLELGADRAKCTEESILLDAGTSGATYQWNSGETTQQNYVGTPGIYMVTITDGGRCSKADTITVTKATTPFAEIQPLPGVCEELILDATEKEGITYSWSTGETTHSILVTEDGKYWVEIFNGECPNSDTIQVSIEYTEPEIIIPNVFTPNADGSNDELKFVLPATETYDLKLYNRWGRLMFESTDSTKNWDGGDAPEGVYEYILVYKKLCGTQETVTETGYVTLLR